MTRMRSKSAIEMALLSAGSLVGSMGETSVVVSSESLPNTLSSNCATAIMLPHLMLFNNQLFDLFCRFWTQVCPFLFLSLCNTLGCHLFKLQNKRRRRREKSSPISGCKSYRKCNLKWNVKSTIILSGLHLLKFKLKFHRMNIS